MFDVPCAQTNATDVFVRINDEFRPLTLGELSAKYDELLTHQLATDDGSSPDLVSQFISETLKARYALSEREVFGLVLMNSQMRVLQIVLLHVGTVNSCEVSTRECIKAALRANACNVVAFHNHPSGNPVASQGDIDTTKRLRLGMRQMEMDLLDHLIIAGPEVLSLNRLGLMN